MNGPDELSEMLDDRVNDCVQAHESNKFPELAVALEGLRHVVVEISKESESAQSIKSDPIHAIVAHIKSVVMPMARQWEKDVAAWSATQPKTTETIENTRAVA